ncbi:MAG: GPW/gp25 family protein [Bacteroidota bacterium]
MQNYLRLPLRFEQFFQKSRLNTCPINHSIASNLHLLITTALGENKLDWEYGSQFWDLDFDIHISADSRRENIISSLKKQIANYEKRIHNVTLEVNVKQTEKTVGAGKQIKRRIEIIITAAISRSNEPFKFQTGFFIGPLAFD